MANETVSSPQTLTPTGAKGPLGLTRRGTITLGVTMLTLAALLLLLGMRLRDANQALAKAPASPLIGHAAPDFTTTAWNGGDGQAIHFAAFKGKAVVLNFWASWCDPCKEETPRLQQAYKTYQAQGVVVIGLAFSDKKENATPFMQKYGVTYPVGPDDKGLISVDYGVTGVPETVFIGRDGTVLSKVSGGVSEDQLREGIQAALK